MSRRSTRKSDVFRAAPVFGALGDETRLALVSRLGTGGPQSIAQLTAGSDVTRQAITKHLNVLGEAGLVRDYRRGRERIWDLDTKKLNEVGLFLDRISKQWDEALTRLKHFVEE